MINKNKEIVLHVGFHKTASTSIQKTMYSVTNKNIMKKNNVTFVEGIWSENNSIPVYSAFSNYPESYHININMDNLGEKLINYNKNVKEDLKNALKNTNRLIISGEDISFMERNELEKMKLFLETECKYKINFKIIIYVRKPISFINSIIQEIIKTGRNIIDKEINYLIKETYKNRIIKFQEIFNNVEIYSFEQACNHEFGPVGHFFDILGIKKDIQKNINFIVENRGMCGEAINICKFIIERNTVDRNLTIKEQDFLSLLEMEGTKFSLSDKLLNEYLLYISEELIWLKDNHQINYTCEIDNLNSIKNVEDQYEELSVIRAFILSKNFVKEGMIEYYNETNYNLFLILNQLFYKINGKDIYKLLYTLNRVPNEISKYIETIIYESDKLYITSNGIDPHFIIPNFVNMNSKKLLIKIEVETNVNSFVQVFYRNEGEEFNLKNQRTCDIEEGNNSIIIPIVHDRIINKLRIDVGAVAATYIINKLEIYSI